MNPWGGRCASPGVRGWCLELEGMFGGGERQSTRRCVLNMELTALAGGGEGKRENKVSLKSGACTAKWRVVPFTKTRGLKRYRFQGKNQESTQLM